MDTYVVITEAIRYGTIYTFILSSISDLDLMKISFGMCGKICPMTSSSVGDVMKLVNILIDFRKIKTKVIP